MAKIVRETHNVFGAAGSSDNFAQFGSEVGGTPIKSKDIATIQALGAWDEGFQDAIYGANKALLLEDLNACIYEHSYQLGYVLQMGIGEWDADTTYFKGSYVQRVDGSGNATGELYVSAVDNNAGNAPPVQSNNANWTYANAPQLPPGSILDHMGIVVPVGFIFCDGSAVSRTTYANLFAAMTATLAGNMTSGQPQVTGLASTTGLQPGHYISGTGVPTNAKILTVDSSSQVTMTVNALSNQAPASITFSPCPLGDGSTTFNVPDARRRATVGAGGTGTSVLPNAVGATGGEETHTLITAEMPAHTHTTPLTTPSGSPPIYAGSGSGGGWTNPLTGTSGSTGGGGAHNNMQPSLVTNKIIKY